MNSTTFSCIKIAIIIVKLLAAYKMLIIFQIESNSYFLITRLKTFLQNLNNLYV